MAASCLSRRQERTRWNQQAKWGPKDWTQGWREDEEMKDGKTLGQRPGLGDQLDEEQEREAAFLLLEAPPHIFPALSCSFPQSGKESCAEWELFPDNPKDSYPLTLLYFSSRHLEPPEVGIYFLIYFLSLPTASELHLDRCCRPGSWIDSTTQNRAWHIIRAQKICVEWVNEWVTRREGRREGGGRQATQICDLSTWLKCDITALKSG